MPPNPVATRTLEVETGLRSEVGRRERNEDYAGVWLGDPGERPLLGVVAALADGMGGEKGGRVAAELTVRAFIEGYVGARPELGVRRAAARSLEAANRWVNAIGRADPELKDMGSTFTALILRGREAHALHVGDSRLYRLREGRLAMLTLDHTLRGAGRDHVLTRAVGPAATLRIDYLREEARPHDRYLLCSDGVHGVLSERALRDALAQGSSPQETAARIVEAAAEARSADNMTALVVDVLDTPLATLADLEQEAAKLPILPAPRTGEQIDGFSLEAVLGDGPYARVFRARDIASGEAVVLKTPKPSVAADAALRGAFLRESWIGRRLRSPYVGASLDVPASRRSCLYAAMPYYEGETLERRLARAPAVGLASGLQIAVKLARGLAALHRAGIIHRDVKPENVILQPDGGLKLVDLGVARLPNLEDAAPPVAPGTPSYMAPELFSGAPGDELSDQFALGATLFRMFAGTWPYGEIEPFSRPRFGRPASLLKLRPDLPAWLERTLARALSIRREDRFADMFELIFELDHGADRAAVAPQARVPLYERNPLAFWKALCALLAAALVAALAALAR
ncbi:bifunctional protein-serine/threonine kinase/phosphatase [Methylocella sp.]|uniref:bifunctional protein-serine/threonine kinase/phosphatase n=1 Tax=Methylocella sp. TaxID=1978226 RepID=UPI0035B0B990